MIQLSRLRGKQFVLNSELIKFVEKTPDTMITLINNERMFVAETMDVVLDRVIAYNRSKRLIPE